MELLLVRPCQSGIKEFVRWILLRLDVLDSSQKQTVKFSSFARHLRISYSD